MATIIKRGDRFMVRVRKEGHDAVSKTFLRRADAVAWGRKVEADMQAGRWALQAKAMAPTLAEAVRLYRERVAINMKGERDYRYAFRDLSEGPLGGVRVDCLTPAQLADWRDAMTARGLKPATVCRQLGMLSGVLSWCQRERGWLSENPMRQVSKPKVRDARTRTLSEAEARYLALATKGARARWLADAVEVLMRSAMRRSELVGLQCSDVDLTAGVAHLRDTKNGEARDVPLCPEAKEALARLMASAGKGKGAKVLPINDPEALSFAFRRAVVRAQERYSEDCATQGREPSTGFLEGVRLHDLRHHSISAWARTGAMSIVDLMKISGHKSPRMLARYAHISAAALAARMALLSHPTGRDQSKDAV